MDERHKQILLALRQIIEEVNLKDSFEETLGMLTERIRSTIEADCCSLYLLDPFKLLRLSATDGLSKSAIGKATLKVGEGLVGQVALKEQMLNIADAPSHPSFKFLPEVGEEEFMSFLGVPLLYQGELLGVLDIQSREMRKFDEFEESFLITIAAQVASQLAILNQNRDKDQNGLKLTAESGAGGIAIAKAIYWQATLTLEDVEIVTTDDQDLQHELFQQTLFQLQIEMDRQALKMREEDKSEAASGYMSGYGQFLDNQDFQDQVDRVIDERQVNAISAVKIVAEQMLSEEGIGKQQHHDIRDFAQVLMTRLAHAATTEPELDEKVILVVKTLPAAWVAELPKDKIAGFIALDDNTSSHTAIMARDLGIPAVIGVKIDLSIIDGRMVIIDGEHRQILIEPSVTVIGEYEQLLSQTLEQSNLYSAEKYEKGQTLDGQRIFISLNAGLNHHADPDLPRQTDGIGLFRTEIAFMLGQTFPTEQQQTEWYEKLLSQFAPLPVCMRTLDIGGDKGLDYFPIEENNAALGWRGVRVSIDQPQLARTQLRAMLRAQMSYGNLEIMVPMVSRYEEVTQLKGMLLTLKQELESELKTSIKMPRFGVMIEVPSMIYMIEEIAQEVQFFSIGSNDLIQYLLAIDRTNPKVSRFFDPFHPAVVRCLSELITKVQRCHSEIAVCGEIAGSPLGALMLLSLGYDRLSMNYSEMGRIRYLVRRVNAQELRELGREALKLCSSQEIRKLYADYAKKQGLGRIVELSEQQK
ncbi:MAG: phosphoenolpyruvate--protein phosphotransferase [Succinivibrio sp.]|nr:phosphoenolpyruvate--protein phosphotransferase [Succinivibrio sp.]